jgi:hypothetical protein
MKGVNGRVARLGQMYFEEKENGDYKRLFLVGYTPEGKKIGLTSEQMRELANNVPGHISQFLQSLPKLRLSIPR